MCSRIAPMRGPRRRSISGAALAAVIPLSLSLILAIPAAADPSAAAPTSGEAAPASDADRPTDPAAEPPVHVDFGPASGLVVDAGHSRLEFHALTWLRAQSDTRVGDETDAEAAVPVARLIWQGHVLDRRLHFFVQPEFGGGGSGDLLDLFAEWHFDEALIVRAGQFRTPYSRAFITPLSNLELIDRGLVVDEFRLGRDTGAMASGDLAGGLLHYDLGVFNGAEIGDLGEDRDAPSVVSRTEIRLGDPVPYDQAPSLVLDDPQGLTIGLGGAWSRRGTDNASGAATTETLWNATVDAAWMHGPWSVHAESFWRGAQGSPESADAFGAFLQAGVFVVPRMLELGGRAGWISTGPDVTSYETFLAAYWKDGTRALGHHLKAILAYRYDSGDRSGGDLRDRHRATLQAQLFF